VDDIQSGPEIAVERGVYSTFHQNMVSWRQANIGSKLVPFDNLCLPNNSVLHVVDQFLTHPITTVLPDLTNPLIKNETYVKYLETLQTIPGEDAPLPITEKYRFRAVRYNQEIRDFWIAHRDIKRPASRDAMIHRAMTLPIINYNEILTAQIIGGTFLYYRQFDLLFRTILNTMMTITDKHQWLQIPLSRTLYTKMQFMQTFETINYQTVRIKNDPSFFFLIHLINFVSKTATNSLFDQIPVAMLDTFNIIMTAGDKAVIYNLGDLKNIFDDRPDNNFYQMVIRHVNTLKLAGFAQHDITGLDEDAYTKLIEDVAPDDIHAVDPTVESPVVEPETPSPLLSPGAKGVSFVAPSSSVKLHSEPKTLAPSKVIPPLEPSKTPGAHSDSVSKKLPEFLTHTPLPTVEPAEPTLPPVITTLPQAPTSLITTIDQGAYHAIQTATHLSEDQRNAAIKAAQLYKTLLLDGVTIEAHLSQTAEPKIGDSHLGFLKNKVVDQSMLSSSAIDLDKHYLEHVMAKDIASVVSCMAINGMLLVKVEQRDEITQLNRIRHYKTVYQDLMGRRHTVSFKFPVVSTDGTIMINGIESRMIKQQVNLPICKIDSNRVSLASSYNKTLVERVGTKAHNFNAYITRYIAAIYKAKVGLTIGYGSLTTSVKLPYDYSSLAARYSTLDFKDTTIDTYPVQYRFIFDYDKRFGDFHVPNYTEAESTFTHEGNLFNQTAMYGETNALPEHEFKVADLKWILQYADTDPERLLKADTLAPILVTKDTKGRLVTIDGFHRLTKAVAEGLLTLPGKLIPHDMLMRYSLGADSGPAGEALKPSKLSYPIIRANALSAYEKHYGVYCGTSRRNGYTYRMFFGYDNTIRFIGPNKGMTPEATQFAKNFTTILFDTFDNLVPPPKPLSEWTELKILDKVFPVVFILGFEYGIQRVLDHLKLEYQFVPNGTRFPRTPTTIVIPFADGSLVFDRYPLLNSFIVAGLLKFNTKPYEFSQFNHQDVYYTLLRNANISLNYLKGISDFFKLFVDPITRDVLLRMHEPTEVGRLLVRATEMLTTEDAIPSASMRNHRLRGYERFTTTLYNEMARSYATYSRQRGNRKSYSINPEAVFLRLIQDQTLHIVEEINPVENIKDKHAATYTGSGGRTAQSFVVEDRQFPADGIGVLSEATPYSGKVAINTYVTADPLIDNIRGMFALDNVDIEKLEPSQIISVPALLMPGSTNDDGKRAAFLSIQLHHHVPSEYSETMRVRTGYEAVLAHRTSEIYACSAKQDGVVEEINNDLGLIKVRYVQHVYPPFKFDRVSSSSAIRSKFTEVATRELAANHPVYVAQADAKTTEFHLHDIYIFNNMLLQVVDILPLADIDTMPMNEYLTSSAKDTLHGEKQSVVVKFMRILHDPSDEVDIFKFGTKFTSAAGSFVKQKVVCNVTVGEKIHRGDILAYNTGFFELDPFDPKQVTWKHGIMANVALIEGNDTIEDSNAITPEFSKRLETASSHLRTLQITANTIIRDLKPIGTVVQTTDLLCTLEDADIASLSDADNNSMLELLTSLNRKAPRARYHGEIAEIDMLYSCPLSEMHPSLAALAKLINTRKSLLAEAASGTHKSVDYAAPAQVTVGTKFHGIEFLADTVMLMFYITEDIDLGAGDKIVLMNQAKSVTATVTEKPMETESHYPVDMLFSAKSVNNRIITSPTTVGFANRVLAHLETCSTDLYFD